MLLRWLIIGRCDMTTPQVPRVGALRIRSAALAGRGRCCACQLLVAASRCSREACLCVQSTSPPSEAQLAKWLRQLCDCLFEVRGRCWSRLGFGLLSGRCCFVAVLSLCADGQERHGAPRHCAAQHLLGTQRPLVCTPSLCQCVTQKRSAHAFACSCACVRACAQVKLGDFDFVTRATGGAGAAAVKYRR